MADDLDPVAVERATAAEVLTLHQRHTPSACLCGWSRLGFSFTQHQADMLAAAGLLVTPEHDAQVAARALREAADWIEGVDLNGQEHVVFDLLHEQVDRIAAGLLVTPEHDAQVAARAWDEGYRDGVSDADPLDGSTDDTPNPYRIERGGA